MHHGIGHMVTGGWMYGGVYPGMVGWMSRGVAPPPSVRHPPPPPPPDTPPRENKPIRSMRGPYASYWNAHLFRELHSQRVFNSGLLSQTYPTIRLNFHDFIRSNQFQIRNLIL